MRSKNYPRIFIRDFHFSILERKKYVSLSPTHKRTNPGNQGQCNSLGEAHDTLTNHLLQPSQKSICVLAQIKEGDRVLDVGCGSGRLTLAAQQWAGENAEAIGIDPSPEMVEVARQNAKRAGSKAKFKLGLAERLPFPDSIFDVVLNRLMLHHLPEDLKQRGLAEMRRVLKGGGICLVVHFEPPKSGLLRLIVENQHDPDGARGCTELCALADGGRFYRY